jgi:hypothetical protein
MIALTDQPSDKTHPANEFGKYNIVFFSPIGIVTIFTDTKGSVCLHCGHLPIFEFQHCIALVASVDHGI